MKRSLSIVSWRWVSMLLILVVLCGIGISAGPHWYSISELIKSADAREIVLRLRIPRVLLAVVVGGSLSVLGAAYQAVFRNSLASPFSLGISSGAALGVSCGVLFPVIDSAPYGSVLCGITGALVTIWLVLRLTRQVVHAQGSAILLVGVTLSFFCSSLLTLLQYISDYSQLFRVTRWMMGGLTSPGPVELCAAVMILIPACIWLFCRHRELDLMTFGDEIAAAKGVEVDCFYRSLFLITSIAIGWMVAQFGVIGFLGIIIPAAVRLVTGPGHRSLLPASFLSGACILVVCDTLGRSLLPPYEIPVGVFTALIGGPAFIWLLGRSRGVAHL